jgi:SnoaL-like domain
MQMQRRSLQTMALFFSRFILLASLAVAANAQTAKALPSDVLAANQELDRQFLEGHRVLDTDKIMGLFTNSPEIFFIGPTGVLYQGREQVRQSIEQFFTRVVSMTGVIDHVTYLPAGDGVIAFGQVTCRVENRRSGGSLPVAC